MAEHADILEIQAPEEASAGDRVTIVVGVKNLDPSTILAKLEGKVLYGSTQLVIQIVANILTYWNWAYIPAGGQFGFLGFFDMPGEDGVIDISSFWYGSDGSWHLDDRMTRPIRVKKVVVYDFAIGTPVVEALY